MNLQMMQGLVGAVIMGGVLMAVYYFVPLLAIFLLATYVIVLETKLAILQKEIWEEEKN